MNPADWARAREVFDAVLARDPAERSAFLDEACADNGALRAEIESLLAAHDGAGDFIERPAFEAAAHLLVNQDPLLDGHSIGPYIVRHEIGRGGMGVVYLADDTRLSRRVAPKVLAPAVGRDAVRRERLRREARAAAALSHPGIATVYALEEIGDDLYLACEYVPGQTLRTLIESGPVPLAQAVDIAVQLSRALAAAHAQGIVHRDLKPENVVRTATGTTKVLDFGIARMDSLVSGRLTGDGEILGTPAYMAPEQVRGEDVDFRADLFSFGVLVHEIVSGSNPFEAGSPTATVARILEVDPQPLSQTFPTDVTGLDRIVAICLRKQPSDRYGSTFDLVADLERLQTELKEATWPPLGRRSNHAPPAVRSTALWWWQLHQGVVSTIYVLMMYPAWRVRAWLPSPWGLAFLLAALASAAAATTLRLHVWFTARSYPSELSVEHARARPWVRRCDVAFAASQLLAALGIGNRHPAFAMLFVTVGVATAIASFVIEPTAARAAFESSAP